MNSKILEDCPAILKDFLFYMETIKGRSARTVEAYYIDLRLLLRYMKATKLGQGTLDELHKIKIDDVTVDLIADIHLSDVYAYLNFVLDQRENNSQTRARKVSSIRSFYRYLTTKAALIQENPVKDLEVPSLRKSIPRHLNLEQSVDLLANVNTKFTQRDYCILTLFLNCGMRVSELCGINLIDLDLMEGRLKLLGKGNKERLIYINEACKDSLRSYLEVRGVPKDAKSKQALFLSQNGNRLTARRVEQIVEQCLKASGLSGKGFSPHKLRHTAATLMYQHGDVDIRVLKEILGHSNLATTEIYTHVSNKQMEKAANLSPLSMIKKKNNLI